MINPNIILGWKRLVIKPSSWLIRTKPLQEGQDLIAKLGWNGDLQLSFWMAVSGDIYYIHKPMIVYRVLAKGSWSKKVSTEKVDYFYDIAQTLKKLDEETSHKYSKIINKGIARAKYQGIFID